MDDDNAVSSLATITEFATNLPAPIRKGISGALSALLSGLTEIPAAWLHGIAQARNDVTAARSLVAIELAKAAAKHAINDPVAMQAAVAIYIPTAVRKAKNKVQIAKLAVERAAETSSDGTEAAEPDDDWMNAFIRLAEDASSERLQDLFSRILAGEVIKPGSFSVATIRTVSELDQSIAQDFSLTWAKSVGGAIDYGNEFNRGDWFSRWKRLAEAGLMAPSAIAQFPPDFEPIYNGYGIWSPMLSDKVHLNVHFSQTCTARWSHIEFTRIGRQVGSILAAPDYEANMRAASAKFIQRGVNRIELISQGRQPETLYAATDE
ncbi:DUF2806 domain-containing protein [Yoonia vestfoldensis]|uniref:DUF2806 domain-containing protein n=1 Tax=Yoonia vestfoldensis TaxID=245188 RepID=UPI0003265BD4|nr:DUF2806 domain-containing protein [Yoonia vestfoldensis]